MRTCTRSKSYLTTTGHPIYIGLGGPSPLYGLVPNYDKNGTYIYTGPWHFLYRSSTVHLECTGPPDYRCQSNGTGLRIQVYLKSVFPYRAYPNQSHDDLGTSHGYQLRHTGAGKLVLQDRSMITSVRCPDLS
jgi:hypothetical protein